MIDRNRLVAYATYHLGTDGEDAVQEALLRVWERYRDPALLEHVGLVRRTLANVVTDEIRKRARRPARVPLCDWLPYPDDVEEIALARDELERTVAFLCERASGRFPMPEILLLALGWTVRELAEWADVPRSTVMSAIARQRSAVWKGVRQ